MLLRTEDGLTSGRNMQLCL